MTRFCAGWIGTTLALLSASVQAADWKVTVQSEQSMPTAIVSAPLPEGLRGKSIKLTMGDSRSVPVQVDGDRFVFVVSGIEKGSAQTFSLAEGKSESAGGVEVTESQAGADITIDGVFFTSYQTHNGPKPYLWPIIGPSGMPMTRAFPMDKKVKGELRDHIHHRGLWFTFDRVNSTDFWAETPTSGKSVHEKFVSMTSGPVFGEIVSQVSWNTRKDAPVAQDVRTYRFYRVPGARLVDFSISMTSSSGPLQFGDSKEGLFAIRVNEQMKVERKENPGSIMNSAGQKNGEAWGKRAEWVDYFGKIDGKSVGIAMFDAPTNFRHPTYWHVRTYGLFAANPFGVSHFTGDKTQDGSHSVPEGESYKANYRVYFHEGGPEEAKVADWYAAYAKPPVAQVSAP
jgi:hypothetical protein